jgi:ubiquinone/menaquinone biosynthesis C-methylase UbiE
MISRILSDISIGDDGIYFYDFENTDQGEEKELRKSVAFVNYQDYLEKISRHHSIPVMDKEVDIFISKIRKNGVIIDVGGCWGWHWRRMKKNRSDISVFIIDLVKENLVHAKNILGSQVNKNIFLVHGDATYLKFPDNSFDGWWSVQTLQHIPDFEKAVKEAWRVLKRGGVFANYSLNNQFLVRCVYKIMGKKYHIHGQVPESYYLSRASREQHQKIVENFSNEVEIRFTEVFFSPELKVSTPGKQGSILGKLDSLLSSNSHTFSWIARQESFHTVKVG